MKLLPLCCLGLLIASTAIVQAQQVEISPFYGYRFGGEVEDINTGETYSFKDTPAYGLFIDVGPTNSDMKVELLWSRQDTSMDLHGLSGVGQVDVTIDQIQIGGSTEIGNEHLREYISVLAGATHYSTDDYGSDTKFSFGIGGGIKYFPFRNVGLRADLRGFCTVVESSGGFISTGGVTVVSYSASTLWQGQATLGVSVAF
jgi:hypothetical protein